MQVPHLCALTLLNAVGRAIVQGLGFNQMVYHRRTVERERCPKAVSIGVFDPVQVAYAVEESSTSRHV